MWSIGTRELVGEQGQVKILKAVKLDWKKDKDGRWNSTPVKGSEFELQADLVLLAMGFVHVEHGPLLKDLKVETDGRGNIARDGTADREKAASDALAAARALAASGLPSLLIDISPRPRPVGRELAAEMRARYLALPHADAQALSNAVQAHARAQGG